MPEIAIRCREVVKRFGGIAALTGFSLDVPAASILSLLGPSGCGKTTALRVIAGLEHPEAGTVEIGNETVTSPQLFVAPERRQVGMVFQEPALFPHLDVQRNIAYGISQSPDRDQRVAELLSLVGLSGYQHRRPRDLSGGEAQRVALARALAPRPHAILLDEPFAGLDTPLRERMRREVRAILLETRATAVFVTHDQEEALAMSEQVAVMREGRVVQVGHPDQVYLHPTDTWVARFLGEAHFLPGEAGAGMVRTSLGVFPITPDLNGPVEVMIRPEMVRLRHADEGGGRVIDHEFFGHDQLITIEMGNGRRLAARTGNRPAYTVGDRVEVTINEVVAFGG